MRILVTGGAGFIGGRLVARLCARGDEVLVVDDLSLGRPEHVPAAARLEVMDVTGAGFAPLVESFRPARVYHLAANSDIGAGGADPKIDLQRTFLTTFAVLEAMRQSGARELVFSSTSAVYGEAPDELRETHGPLQPISQYGAAKLASEAYVSAAAHLGALRAWVFRFPNVVGPNLTHGAIFDFIARLWRDRTTLRVLGNGTQTKPYLHVDDLLDAIELAVARPAEPLATYNIAGEGATSVRAIAEMVRRALDLPNATIEYGTEDRGWPGDVPRFSYDTTKIRALGWRPTRDSDGAVWAAIEDGVKRCKPSS